MIPLIKWTMCATYMLIMHNLSISSGVHRPARSAFDPLVLMTTC